MEYFWYAFAFVFVTVIICLIYYNAESVVKRKLRNTEQRKISEFKEGDTAKISGKVKFMGNTLIAPLSGRKCSYFSVLVEEDPKTDNSSLWRTLIQEDAAGDIVIFDGSDYAVIQTQVVKSYLIQDAEFTSGFLKNATDNLKNYLARHGEDSENILGMNRTLRYQEGILQENETLTVVGKGQWLQKQHISINIPAERVLFIGFGENETVYFTDDIA